MDRPAWPTAAGTPVEVPSLAMLAAYLVPAMLPVTRGELIAYACRTGAPQALVGVLRALPRDERLYWRAEEVHRTLETVGRDDAHL